MPRSTIDDTLPPMRAGERESRAGGEQYCLSPLPLPIDSEHGVDVAHIDVRHDEVTMDLRQGATPESLLVTGHIASGLMTFLAGLALVFLLSAVYKGSLPFELVVAGVGVTYGIALFPFFIGILYPDVILRRIPPIRLHRQRREVAFVVESRGQSIWLPDPTNMWLASTAGTIAMLTGFFAIWDSVEFFRPDVEAAFPLMMLLLHIASLAFLPLYPYFHDFCRKLVGQQRQTVLVPWEDVVALAVFNPNLSAGAVTGFGWNFALMPPDPERPGYTLPGAGIIVGVGGLPGALAQWEYIRRFMEEGPEAITSSAREWGLEWYDAYVAREKAECERTHDKARWRRFRREQWWNHARFAHWYTEYRMKHVLPKAVPKGWLAGWSRPLPRDQWARPSRELTELGEQLRAAYQRGEKFIKMGNIEKRFGVEVEPSPGTAYRTLPFAASAA
ncbi:hypothetical protein ACN2MM_04850 [Alkalilimnicola ehrlichii MLHE-1]|uniref:Transmembrane protein n=1 Tax=Alkalilimnicola ehrlichii (strain ATCC BAA-1101 / DSM 17681 / MLHE-1) TaxID=187272 RepID=Q0AAE0_ALKEH|nr:hypothetical protein [Alkalilimnicola ehrlichii]ABI56197.1 hypothetical protein Mlg_0843 [Alkalilimnicola ehrlichii MLHE-1]